MCFYLFRLYSFDWLIIGYQILTKGLVERTPRDYKKMFHQQIHVVASKRQHVGAWVAGNQPNAVPKSPALETTSPERLRGTTQDLFELLERVQSSRLDDQRCVLPAYFSQGSVPVFKTQNLRLDAGEGESSNYSILFNFQKAIEN
ncbi:hypothetical protein Bhyg_04900 [Pseudolycoriella hygida]|uniref:Uncharacterized protein n=1 Tax=Pseudolycoriella hygida TaxID=35572 RepID=A0A9Q0NGU2_9DIPT|nr:hypothetical protein Bhyg_04900 [Pseudolycoriella hygida]